VAGFSPILLRVPRPPRWLLASSVAAGGLLAARALRRTAARSDELAPPRRRALLPVVGSGLDLMRSPTQFQRRSHAALGPVFTATVFGFELTFVDRGELLSRVLGASSEEYNLVAAYRQMFARLLGAELFLDAPPEAMRGLGPGPLRRHTPALGEFLADLIAARLRAGDVDLLALSNTLAFHASCWYVCGAAIPEQRRDELAHLFHVMESDFSVLGSFSPIETPSWRRRVAARARALDIFRDEVRARLARPGDESDYMQSLLDVYAPQSGGPASEAQIERAALGIMGLVFGAHTNTSIAIAATLLDIIERPALLAAIREEQARVLSDRPLDFEALTRLPALFRAINETLRLRSNGGVWRKLLRPTELGGYRLPAGALVGSMMGLLNADDRVYACPERFDPERYAAMQTDQFQCPSVSAQRPLFGAFGAGRHVCPGRPLAYVILGLATSLLLRGRNFAVRRRPAVWFDLMTAGLARPIGKLIVRATPA
jgi:cytochrome P450